jgi:uncharacterized protein YbjT (DUF2867 family)
MQTDVVTGAFGYSGAAIARELLAAGHQVRTLTGHPGNAPAGSPIEARPLDFADADGLARDLRGAHTLYNTYWVRFPHGRETHATAVANSRVLFDAAARAGIERIVHVSITHADAASPYPYFSGKAAVEAHLRDLGVPYAVARPAILFGGHGVLLNNIGWLLRRLPVFAVGGRGEYRIRPIHVGPTGSRSTRSDRTRSRSATWCWRSGPPSAAGRWSCPPPAGRSRRYRPPWAPRCTTSCSPGRSTGRWRTAWPTPTPRRPDRPA